MGQYSNRRSLGREHIPVYPPGFIALRIIQLILSVILLGVCGYIQSWSDLSLVPVDVNIFTGSVTLICCIYYIVAQCGPPSAYNYWAILSLDLFLLIFWLVSFGWLAAVVAYLQDYYYCYTDDGCVALDMIKGIVGGAAGVGAIEFVLFLISLIIHSVVVHRHRSAGLHNRPVKGGAESVSMLPLQQQPVNPTYQSVPQQEAMSAGQPYAYHQNAYAGQMATPSPVQYHTSYGVPHQQTAYYPSTSYA